MPADQGAAEYAYVNVGINAAATSAVESAYINVGVAKDPMTAGVQYAYLNIDDGAAPPPGRLIGLIPDYGREGWQFTIVGVGLGVAQADRESVAYLGALELPIVSWTNVARTAGAADQFIDEETGTTNVEHQEILVTVPPGAQTGLVTVCGDTALPPAELVGTAVTTLGDAGTQTLALNKPAGIQTGDYIAVFAQTRNAFLSTPTGGQTWTQRGGGCPGLFSMEALGTTDEQMIVWDAVASGPDPTINLPVTDNGTMGLVVVVAVVRNAAYGDHAGPVFSNSAPSVNGIADGVLLCWFGSSAETGQYTGAPPGMAEAHNLTTGGPSNMTMMFATQLLTSTGATGSKAAPEQAMDNYLAAFSLATGV